MYFKEAYRYDGQEAYRCDGQVRKHVTLAQQPPHTAFSCSVPPNRPWKPWQNRAMAAREGLACRVMSLSRGVAVHLPSFGAEAWQQRKKQAACRVQVQSALPQRLAKGSQREGTMCLQPRRTQPPQAQGAASTVLPRRPEAALMSSL
jgi:hypothetical protein